MKKQKKKKLSITAVKPVAEKSSVKPTSALSPTTTADTYTDRMAFESELFWMLKQILQTVRLCYSHHEKRQR